MSEEDEAHVYTSGTYASARLRQANAKAAKEVTSKVGSMSIK